MTRTIEKQKLHDKCVEDKVKLWKKDGYIVFADIEGWNKPPEIEGYIPDVVARKHGTARICEIETEDTLEAHRPQLETFKRYADNLQGATFWLFIAQDDGKCKYVKY